MLKKILIFFLFFYLLALWQTSFLVHFGVLGWAPLIAIFVILINLLEKAKNYSGLLAALIGGFFLDIFSASLIGQNTLILLALALFIKMVLRKYVWAPVI